MANIITNDIVIGTIVITKDMLVNLFKAIGSYTGTTIGTSVYNAAFGNQVKDLSTDALYKEISKLVKDENKRQSIAEQLAVVSAANSFYLIDYANKKEQITYTSADKVHDLSDHLTPLSQAISFFKGDYVKKNAINEFVLGAAIALMYYKELAILAGGVKSAEYKTYRTYLSDFYKHAKDVSDGLLSDRTQAVTAVKRSSMVIGDEPCVSYGFDDKFDGKHYGFDAVTYGEKKAEQLAENKRNEIIDSFRVTLKTITDVLKEWKELIDSENFDCTMSDAFGDVSTNSFDDISITKGIKKLIVKYGCVVDGITIVYEDDTFVHHGGYGGDPVEVLLDAGDYITQIDGYIEKWGNNPQRALSLITFKTQKGKTYGPYGRRPYSNHKYDPIKEENRFTLKNGGKKVIGFYGNNSHDNNFICRIGVYWK